MPNSRIVLASFALALGACLGSIPSQAGDVVLPRALDGENARSLPGVTRLEEKKFDALLPEATLVLSEGSFRQENEDGHSRLSDADRRTVLEAALRREKRLQGYYPPEGVLTQLQYFFSAATSYNPESPYRLAHIVQDTLESKFEEEYRQSPERRRRWWRQWSTYLWRRSPRFNDRIPLYLAGQTGQLVVYAELLRRLEAKSDEAPDVWAPLLDAAYDGAERELLWLDRQLKVVAQYDSETADEISAIAVASLISSEDPKQEKICKRLFQALQDKAMLNVWANRYFTRSASFLLSDIAAPVRAWAFRTFIVGALIAGLGMAIHDPQFARDTHFAYPMTRGAEDTWLSLVVLRLCRDIPLGIANVSDAVLNTLSRVLAIDNKGPLWNAQQFNRGTILLRCKQSLAKRG